MTLTERVSAVAAFGFTPREAGFLVTVALHGGYCLRRQYAAFTGQRSGKNVRDFLDGMVERDLARSFTYRPDRGHIYHVCARGLYRAIGQEDNRNGRHTSPALIARRLMLLDLVLTLPDRDWYATEADKVDLFVNRLGVPADALPHRTYQSKTAANAHGQSTTRYCIQKLPVFFTGNPPHVHFVCLVTARKGQQIEVFVREHAALLTHLRSWTLHVTGPRQIADEAACAAAYGRGIRALSKPGMLDATDVQWFFNTRRLIGQDELRDLSVADLRRFRKCCTRWAGQLDGLYAEWLDRGPVELHQLNQSGQPPTSGQLVTHWLPHSYSQFGTLPGIC